MKAILITIKPQHLCNILNGTKTLEIRKNKALYNAIKKMIAEKGKATIYVVCSKGGKTLIKKGLVNEWQLISEYIPPQCRLNGKVLCKWECDRVEHFDFCECDKYENNVKLYNECVKKDNELCKKACISCVKMVEYLHPKHTGYAIPIQNLVVFDKSLEITMLRKVGFKDCKGFDENGNHISIFERLRKYSLSSAPQNFAYCEVE